MGSEDPVLNVSRVVPPWCVRCQELEAGKDDLCRMCWKIVFRRWSSIPRHRPGSPKPVCLDGHGMTHVLRAANLRDRQPPHTYAHPDVDVKGFECTECGGWWRMKRERAG